MIAAARALAEVNALRSGDPEASERRVHRFAAVANAAPPLVTARANRALAYLAHAKGQHEQAVASLQRARSQAEAGGQLLDVAIADYQLGHRLGGDEGATRRANALAITERIGASTMCLHEDLAFR
jgi:ATP/maltotriose-dependent transcriptional regulator MalT